MGDGGKHDGNDLQRDALSEKLKSMEKELGKEKTEELEKKLTELPSNQPIYRHKEAYCIMKYQCKRCNSVEHIWNSRDGVTPFGVTCRYCKGSDMLHVDWHGDVRDPLHIPKEGDRIFIDMPEEVHRIYMMIRIDRFWDHNDVPMKKHFGNKAQALRELAKTFNEGEPMIFTWE